MGLGEHKGFSTAIQPGEGRIVALSSGLAFSALGLNVLVVGSVTALFLGTRSRAELPYAYATASLFGVVASCVMLSVSGKVTRGREARGVFWTLGLALLLTLLLLPWAGSAVLHAGYPICLGLAALAIVQAYAVINDCLDPAQVKRLLPLIGVGGTLGAMAAGAAMAFVAPLFGTRALLVVALVALLGLSFSAHLLMQGHLPDRALSERPPQPASSLPLSMLWRDAHLLIQDRLIARYALTQFVVWTASTLLRYQFETALARELSHDKIAAFLGVFNLASNAAVLLLQALLEARVLRVFGLGVGLTSTSLVLGAGLPFLLLAPSFWFVGAVRFCEQILRFSLARSAEELLLLPLSSTTRRKARTFVTVALTPVGIFSAAMLVIALSALPRAVLVGVTWLIAVLGFGLALSLKAPYVQRLQDALVKPRPSFAMSTTVSRAMRAAHLSTEARAALELQLVDAKAEERRRKLFAALEKPSEERLAEVTAGLDVPALAHAAAAVLCEWPSAEVVGVVLHHATTARTDRKRAVALHVLGKLPHAEATTALESLVRATWERARLDVLVLLARRRAAGISLGLPVQQVIETCLREGRRWQRLDELAAAQAPEATLEARYERARAVLALEAARAEERVFVWLALLYPGETLERARLSLHAADRRAAAFAFEVLEQLLEPRLFRELFAARAAWSATTRRQPLLAAGTTALGLARQRLAALEHPLARPLGLYLQLLSPQEGDPPMALVETMMLLRAVPLFAELASEELWSLAELVEVRSLAQGEAVLQEGETAAALFLVLGGELELRQGAGAPVRLGKGECFGHLSLLGSTPHGGTVTALTNVELGAIAATEFEEMLDASPGISRGLLRALSRRVSS